MSEAIKYVGLIGKYVRMERPATEDELADQYPDTMGMTGFIAGVWDKDGGVEIMSDEGIGFLVSPGEDWRFWIFPDEETATSTFKWNRNG